MGEMREDILKGLKTAMEAELTGHNFYKNAAQNVTDARAKEALWEMAEDEKNHFNYLRHQYRAVLETGNYDLSKAFLRKGGAEEENPIFTDAIKERIRDSHYEVSVLTIGMKLELDAIHFYQECAKKAQSKGARKFYEELASWEIGHYEAFKRALDDLKEEYWRANNFVPM